LRSDDCGAGYWHPERGGVRREDQESGDLPGLLGNPVKLESQRIGTYVLLFLAFFFVFAYLLKREYWKDVH